MKTEIKSLKEALTMNHNYMVYLRNKKYALVSTWEEADYIISPKKGYLTRISEYDGFLHKYDPGLDIMLLFEDDEVIWSASYDELSSLYGKSVTEERYKNLKPSIADLFTYSSGFILNVEGVYYSVDKDNVLIPYMKSDFKNAVPISLRTFRKEDGRYYVKYNDKKYYLKSISYGNLILSIWIDPER